MVSGLGAAFIFTLLWIILPGENDFWFALIFSLVSYFGIRLVFRSLFFRKISIQLPAGLSREDFTVFLIACSESLTLLKKDAELINKLSFRHTVLHLCVLGDELLVNFEKDPQDVQAARELPDRLQRLHEILAGYLDLANQRNQSPQTLRAIQDTEKAVTKAVATFEQLHHRLLENDAIDLSTSARTLDNLLDFD
ncbi:MAG: 5-bromo-4-chloroindolyl phosphate hydrolysis family protein [Candidatus Electrothrix sp. GW3-4]|uniref:5-bromo-4-chloroindolyl phosphate hydrolysis family protein n=1 Tax=Candidatus Electrothrix sp. GW3-4 TaxID=3126740 RepID=UPI0030D101C2